MEKVSIIIPVYNSERTLERCINSIVLQSQDCFEIILVDDGSTDNSAQICDLYAKKDCRIKVFHKENGGVSSARNFGIKKASFSHILFIDSDDYISKNALETFQEEYQGEETLLFLKMKNFPFQFYDTLSVNDAINKMLVNQFYGFIAGVFFEKKYIESFDEKTSYMEDMIFLVNYLKKVKYISYMGAEYYYDQTINSITRNISVNKIAKNILDIDYSLNRIQKEILTCSYFNVKNLHQKIIEKKAKIIESECSKLSCYSDYQILLQSHEIKNIFLQLKQETKKIKYKLFYGILIKNYKLVLSLYIFARKKLKKLKNIIKVV